MATNYNSNFDVTIPFSDTCVQVSLAANVEQTYTVPGEASQKYQAIFGYAATANVYVGYNVTAASPAGGTNNTTGNIECRPDKRYVKGGDVLHFVSPDAGGAYIGMSLRALPG